jgi:hypothetical protein
MPPLATNGRKRFDLDAGATHEKPQAGCDAVFSNFGSSPVLRGATLSKPERVIAERP